LTKLLTNEEPVKGHILETQYENLWLLPCGPTPPNPADLLSTGGFKEIVAEASQHFGRIVIDGPPVQGLALKAILLVLGPIVLFGFILRGAGLASALLILVIVSAYASSRFRWPIAVALSVGLSAFALLVFVMGLGLPIPVIGRWFG